MPTIDRAYIANLSAGDELTARTIDAAMVLRFKVEDDEMMIYPGIWSERLRRQLRLDPLPWTTDTRYALNQTPPVFADLSSSEEDVIDLAEYCGVDISGIDESAVAMCKKIIDDAFVALGLE